MRNFQFIFKVFAAVLILFAGKGHCCGKPVTPEDGFFTPLQDKYPEGARVTYSCNVGFSLKVNQNYQMYNYCMKNRWNNTSPPICVKNPTCGAPGIPENGVVTHDEQKNSLRYSCEPGYILLGNSVKTCSRIMTWIPQEMPKCVSNLAYHKEVLRHGVSGDLIAIGYDNVPILGYGDIVSIVDGDFNLCKYVVVKKSEYLIPLIGIDLGRVSEFTNILVTFKNGTKIAVSLKYSDGSLNRMSWHRLTDFISDYVTTHLWYNTSVPEKTRYIFLEPMTNQPNDFTICEIQMFNSLETNGCGTPDEIANGAVINESYPGKSRYQYKCDIGYSMEGNSVIECRNGQWSNLPPICREFPRTPGTTTPSISITTVPTNPTPIPTSKDDDDDSKEKVIGIMDISIAFIAVSVLIAMIVSLIVFISKRCCNKNKIKQMQRINESMRPDIIQDQLYDDTLYHEYESINYEDQQPSQPRRQIRDSQIYETPILKIPGSTQYLEIVG